MDLRQRGEPFEKKYIQFSPEQIAEIADDFHTWQQDGGKPYHDVPEYCYSANIEEIAERGYSLVPSKYIEFINRDEGIDYNERLRELNAELMQLLEEEAASRKELITLMSKLTKGKA